jgi:hypothetical protein
MRVGPWRQWATSKAKATMLAHFFRTPKLLASCTSPVSVTYRCSAAKASRSATGGFVRTLLGGSDGK